MRPVEEDIDGKPAAERVDNAGAHAVEAAGICVILVIELAAGVQHGEDDLHTGDAEGGMGIDRHAAAVVPHAGGTVLMQGDGDLVREAVGGFVDRVVHDLPEEMVEAAGGSCSDIHAGTHADGFEAFQYLDVPGVIGLRCHGFTPFLWFKLIPGNYTIKWG